MVRMMSKTEKALRWRFAWGMCAVLSFCYGVLFIAEVPGIWGLVLSCVFWMLTILFICALIVTAYRQMTEQNRENLR